MLRNLTNYGLGSFMTSMIAHAPDDDEGLTLIDLDISLDEAEKPEELPAGVYNGEVQDVQIATSAKGNKYFAVKFVIPPEEIAADVRDGFPDGAVLFWNRQVVPSSKDRRALFNLRRFIEALGLPTSTSQVDPNEWMGQRARLRVVMGKYQGEDRAEIRAIEPAESAAAPARRGATRAAPKETAAPARAARRGR